MDAATRFRMKKAQMRAQRTNYHPSLNSSSSDKSADKSASDMLSSLMALQSVKGHKERRKKVVEFFTMMRDMNPDIVRLVFSMAGQGSITQFLDLALREKHKDLYNYFTAFLKDSPNQLTDQESQLLSDVPIPVKNDLTEQEKQLLSDVPTPIKQLK
jgi:hypothetical protein